MNRSKSMLFVLASTVLSIEVFCQVTGIDTLNTNLVKLEKPKRPYPKYVNFDVFKLTPGYGLSPTLRGAALSFHGQFLWPKALLKNTFPVAVGLAAGNGKILGRKMKYTFSNGEISSISRDDTVKYSLQETGYAGLLFLHVIRRRSITVLVGPALNVNFMKSELREKSVNGTVSIKNDKTDIHKISVPLHLQVSWSRKQFFSIGMYLNYDTRPRFKSDELKKIHQLTLGMGLAVII